MDGRSHAGRSQALIDDPDFLRELVERTVQAILEAEMTAHLGAGRYERGEGRSGYRNGTKPRRLVTRVGTLELAVPQDRDGTFSTELFARYQRSEQALVSTLLEMVSAGGVDAESGGDHRGTVRDGLLEEPGVGAGGAAGRRTGGVADPAAGGARLPVPERGRPLRARPG